MSEPELPAPRQSEARGVILLADDEEAVRWPAAAIWKPTGGSCWRPGTRGGPEITDPTRLIRLVVTDPTCPGSAPDSPRCSIFRPSSRCSASAGPQRRQSRSPAAHPAEAVYPGSLLQAVRMACGLSVRVRRPPENRRRAASARAHATGTPANLLAAVLTLRFSRVAKVDT
jgi:hypothetical protein